jgi:hypothetical protein
MAVKREVKHETAIETLVKDPKSFFGLVQAGHIIGTPEPIFREIKESEAEAWRKQFGGDK